MNDENTWLESMIPSIKRENAIHDKLREMAAMVTDLLGDRANDGIFQCTLTFKVKDSQVVNAQDLVIRSLTNADNQTDSFAV